MKQLQIMAKNITILYVEDEESIRNETASLLNLIFKKVYIANNGDAGYKAFMKFSPDIVLSDIQMPIKTGIEMATEIRVKNKTIPIVFITAFNQENMLLDAINLGIDKYLLKPLCKDQIVQVFTKIVTQINIEKEKIELENKLIKTQHCLEKALEIAQVGCWEWDIKNDMVWYSYTACEIFEQEICELSMTNSSEDIIKHIHIDDKERVMSAIDNTIRNGANLDISFKYLTKNNTTKVLHILKVKEENSLIIGMVEDITKNAREKDKLAKMASQDLLTGLPNKALYQVFLNKQFTLSTRYHKPFTLLKFVINDFKELNDQLGSNKADKLIVEFTKLITRSIRESDLFVRIYGVEFAIILPQEDINGTRILIRKLNKIISENVFRNAMGNTLRLSFAAIEYSTSDLSILKFIERMDDSFNEAKLKSGSIVT